MTDFMAAVVAAEVADDDYNAAAYVDAVHWGGRSWGAARRLDDALKALQAANYAVALAADDAGLVDLFSPGPVSDARAADLAAFFAALG